MVTIGQLKSELNSLIQTDTKVYKGAKGPQSLTIDAINKSMALNLMRREEIKDHIAKIERIETKLKELFNQKGVLNKIRRLFGSQTLRKIAKEKKELAARAKTIEGLIHSSKKFIDKYSRFQFELVAKKKLAKELSSQANSYDRTIRILNEIIVASIEPDEGLRVKKMIVAEGLKQKKALAKNYRNEVKQDPELKALNHKINSTKDRTEARKLIEKRAKLLGKHDEKMAEVKGKILQAKATLQKLEKIENDLKEGINLKESKTRLEAHATDLKEELDHLNKEIHLDSSIKLSTLR